MSINKLAHALGSYCVLLILSLGFFLPIGLMQAAVSEGALGGAPQEMAETWFLLLIGDLQIRRVTGALATPRPDYIETRAASALARLRILFPPARLDVPATKE